ncbi:hypothetical protein [Pseudomonas moraviensis]|uniref:hypothetical protein n=1 Tax=Pseudomonas moraviensis TaxID=321662 RepID=UPI001CB9B927|nr:hypothetical protein [Pseudomonas moraviensis]
MSTLASISVTTSEKSGEEVDIGNLGASGLKKITLQRSETVRTLEMGKTGAHGYADIIVRSVTTGLAGEGPPDSCELKTTHEKPVLTTLRYDGKTYVLPQGFKGM